ncbi:hypothetical protein C0993_004679 [Termitomyces sp. T159_Od127]|nr:hypothetical protein C0993_004679 [Termitomyces sp. T159_Od127]
MGWDDLLELKEIQRSLPRAQQLPDPVSGKPPSYILDHVPIGLLPLLPAPAPRAPQPAPPPAPAWPFPPLRPRPPQPAAPSTAWVPAHMQHLLPRHAPPQPSKPAFAFLPLLEPPCPPRSPSPPPDSDTDPHSDASSSHDPPTPPLTNASLESSPLSRASSDSDSEPAYLSLDPWHEPASPTTAWHPFPDRSTPKRCPPPPLSQGCRARRKNVMILNGIEISLDDDDEAEDGHNADDDESTPSPTSHAMPVPIPHPASPRRCSMSLHYPSPHTRSMGFADVASPWAG